MNDNQTWIVLPKKLFERAENKEHFKQLVLDYMKRYPDYSVKMIKNGMARCNRN
ncbi:hypothetical protein [Cytobacillus sp.]|uniref:hypothetical protein n=1 Tax=Cytobacillus sp. TaxID=2675269 RepID=UPI0035111115